MADNVAITPGSGDSIAADDISGAKYQRIKIIHGADGVNDGDVSSANPLPVTTSGVSTFRTLDLDESEEEIKATAGNVYGYYFYNASASVRYLKWYNATVANVTVGSTTPFRTYPLPPNSAGHISLPYPISFSTAITVAATTGLADNDSGAPGTNEVILNVDYK